MYYEHYTIGGELYHHGILGQKWGDRNGPPYPLGSGDHSAKEKKAGWRKSLSGGKESKKKKKEKEGLVVDAMTGQLKNNKALNEAAVRRYRMEHDYLLKPIIDKIDRKRESEDHLVSQLNSFEAAKEHKNQSDNIEQRISELTKLKNRYKKQVTELEYKGEGIEADKLYDVYINILDELDELKAERKNINKTQSPENFGR